MKKQLGLFIILVIGVGFVYYFKTKPREVTLQLPQIPSQTEVVAAVPPSTATPDAVPSKSKVELSISERIKATPLATKTQYRDDVQADPHGPSPRLIESAMAMAELMKNVKTENEASEVLAYYENCLSGADTPNPLKAACYRYSGRLAQRFPVFAEKVKALDGQVDDDVRTILNRSRR